jgi:FkbM family methyltransferase
LVLEDWILYRDRDAGERMSDYYVRIKGDVLVKVPPEPSQITTWVLLEQEDWFEKEINFVRRWLKPGMRAIDVGANVGVYALTMAKLVAPGGSVWAFEPTRPSAAMLRQSVARNDVGHLHVVQMALSDRCGSAALRLHAQSELNSLIHAAETEAAETETVSLSTLDRQQTELDWGRIDFIKIDAEGSGSAILAGGARFFAEQSPLVMFETDDSQAGIDKLTLPAAFRKCGYEVYRLIGPDLMLVPLGADEKTERFELNLFACRPDRADSLAAAGLLAPHPQALPTIPGGGGLTLFGRQIYAAAFGALAFRDDSYRDACDAYAVWRDTRAAPIRRWSALSAALTTGQEAARQTPSIARLSTLARIAFEAGERQLAIDTLWRIIVLFQDRASAPDEPFFPPAERYEAIDPGNFARDWLVAATIEAWEKWRSFSGRFIPVEAQRLALLDWLQSTQFASAPMERRRQLQRWLAGLQSGPQAMPILSRVASDHLNPALWTAG